MGAILEETVTAMGFSLYVAHTAVCGSTLIISSKFCLQGYIISLWGREHRQASCPLENRSKKAEFPIPAPALGGDCPVWTVNKANPLGSTPETDALFGPKDSYLEIKAVSRAVGLRKPAKKIVYL